MDDDFDAWQSELTFTGNIVQDGDETVSDAERHARFMRYIELLDAVDGSEGIDAARAIIRSIQARDDYGAYQTTQHALGRFPSAVSLRALIDELPSLIDRQRDWAGELLCGLANSVGTEWEPDVEEFNALLRESPESVRQVISDLIANEEDNGWLKHRVGVLGSSA